MLVMQQQKMLSRKLSRKEKTSIKLAFAFCNSLILLVGTV